MRVTEIVKSARKQIEKAHPFIPAVSTGWNLVYAAFHFILSYIYSSWWFLTLGFHHDVHGLMRLLVLKNGDRKPSVTSLWIGIAFIILANVVAGMISLSIREQINPVRNRIVMIAVAAYTFSLFVLAIRNMIIARRKPEFTLIALRNISLSAATGSMLSLERAMLGTFGDPENAKTTLLEGWTGAGTFVLLLCMGVGMMLYARKLKKQG
ncbi:MAG: hypothetical protein IKR85_05985 [Clostridia bacterium]|nr:hypothetical protein [Clostridia bacterium]